MEHNTVSIYRVDVSIFANRPLRPPLNADNTELEVVDTVKNQSTKPTDHQ